MLSSPTAFFRNALVVLALCLLGAGSATAHSASILPDGSFEVVEGESEDVAVQLARAFLARHTADFWTRTPEFLTARIELSPDVKEVEPELANGFLAIRFQTDHYVHLESPPDVSSPEDLESWSALMAVLANDGKWTVRFFQSPETSRWHLISHDEPETSTRPSALLLPIENVNRDEFRARTRGPKAPVLGELIFIQYLERVMRTISEEYALPVTLDRVPRDFVLEAPEDNDAILFGPYRLTVVCGQASWDAGAFPWSGSPAGLMTALALTFPGESHWEFPMQRMGEERWKVSGELSLSLQDARIHIAVVEETASQYYTRLANAQNERSRELAAESRAQRLMQRARTRDAAAQSLWLAETDGIHMARMILAGNCRADPFERRMIENTLQGRYVQPLQAPCPCGVDWANAPVHDLRPFGSMGEIRQFEFNLEALPTEHIIPVELWVSFTFDRINMERLKVGTKVSEDDEKGETEYVMNTLFVSQNAERLLAQLPTSARSGSLDYMTGSLTVRNGPGGQVSRVRSYGTDHGGGGGCAGCGPGGAITVLMRRDPSLLLMAPPPETPRRPVAAP